MVSFKGNGQIKHEFYILRESKKIEKATKTMFLQSIVKYLFPKGIYCSAGVAQIKVSLIDVSIALSLPLESIKIYIF